MHVGGALHHNHHQRNGRSLPPPSPQGPHKLQRMLARCKHGAGESREREKEREKERERVLIRVLRVPHSCLCRSQTRCRDPASCTRPWQDPGRTLAGPWQDPGRTLDSRSFRTGEAQPSVRDRAGHPGARSPGAAAGHAALQHCALSRSRLRRRRRRCADRK